MFGILWAAVFAAVIVATTSVPASAQDFPNKPIRLILGYAPGASTDLMARFTADHMSNLLGQRIVVENRPGADSLVATRYIAQQPPDGYTLLFGTMTVATNLHAFKEPGYKLDDFIPVAAYGYTGYTLFVNTTSSGANTIQDFIAFGKANPGKLTYSTLGPGSSPALVANRFDSFAKLGWREVSFKSAADAVGAVVAGTVDVYMAAPSTALASMGRPNIKVFAVTGDVRSPVLPNVPTFSELGYPVKDSISLGVFAPKGTPPAVIEKLRWSIEESKKNPENRKRIEATGLQIYEDDYQHFTARLKTASDVFAEDMKRLNIQPTE